MVAPSRSRICLSALASRQREVKDVADRQVVYITENGNGAYVFCSEEIFDRELKQAREDARYEAEMEFVLRRGKRDIEEGRFTTDVDGFVAAFARSGGLMAEVRISEGLRRIWDHSVGQSSR